MTEFPVATLTLSAAITLVSLRGATHPEFVEKYLFSSGAIRSRREYWRLVTSGFLHANFLHLAGNLLTIWLFGSEIEAVFGAGALLMIYFASLVGGDAVSWYVHRHQEYRALGASGGACGVVFACVYLFPGMQMGSWLQEIHLPAWLYAVMFLVVSYYGLRAAADNVGHDAHIGGALIGLGAAIAMRPRLFLEQPLVLALLVGVSAAIVYGLWKDAARSLPRCVYERPPQAPRPVERPRELVTPLEQLQVDVLLDKIAKHGLQSLSDAERKLLDRVAAKKRRLRPPG